ncbi:hypothetical protein EZV62_012393 [Acer yangbiense]|uniref:Zinc knuckle CX2CX4HX4C domain-containing protein n=1 Tax=Acer yangbiense TaxID=1000413 RepID=A0A5C7HVR6_9ROSI|nr:hypothetical protein EZV62_012393 [Acer yangbiense]
MCSIEIEKLYESLSLAEEDNVVLEMSNESSIDGIEDMDRCLVGKVLSGKKVNREAFKGLIEQIWSPFGQVEVNLISLEKPVGLGNIAKLGFNKAEFWIQIHDIPILCMNRRTAKWLAEQLGEVVEIPSESRECWGKFMRVKVSIDISKPLKRWLRFKLGTIDEIIMVGLKYERLPNFCFACGRIGNGIKECMDEAARKATLDGSPTRYGSWLKAPILEKGKSRFSSQVFGSSSDRSRSLEGSRDTTGDGSGSMRPKLQASLRDESAPSTVAMMSPKKKTSQ